MNDRMDRAARLAQYMIGSSDDVMQHAPNYGFDDWPMDAGRDGAAAFDEVAFCCDVCGWWCGSEHRNDTNSGQVCSMCLNEHDGEE